MSHGSTENPFLFFKFERDVLRLLFFMGQSKGWLGAGRRRTGGGGEGLAGLCGYEACLHALAAWPKAAYGLLVMEADDNSGCCLRRPG